MGLAGVDTSRLATYSEDVAADPTLIGLRDKVSFDFRTGIPNTFAEITLQLRDGSTVSAQHDAGKPASDAVEQGRRLEAKFAALADPVVGTEKAAKLIVEIGRLETLPDVRGLMALCGA